jgi:hypothetical protein
MKVVMPIESQIFDSSIDSFQLDNNWTIRHSPGSVPEENISWNHVIEGELSDPDEGAIWRRELDRIILLFRLYRPGRFQIRTVLGENDRLWRMNYYYPWVSSAIEPDYQISSKEIRRFVKHFHNYKEIFPEHRYSLRAFKEYYYHPRYVNRFIAIAIALDGLVFLPSERSNRYNFANRLLGILNPSHSQAFHKDCVRFYIMRNHVLHGLGMVDLVNFVPIADRFEARCRKVIMRLHDRGALLDESLRKQVLESLPKCSCGINAKAISEKIELDLKKKLKL